MVDGKEIPTFKFHYSVQGNKQMGKYGLCFSGEKLEHILGYLFGWIIIAIRTGVKAD